jgi:hypothetical protein
VTPAGLPAAESHAHGTRARYVSAKCRCVDCRGANNAYYHQRQARAKALAAELVVRDVGGIPQRWTPPGGTPRERVYKRACPGIGGGLTCIANGGAGAHLRSDSKGAVCRECRELLVWNGDLDAAPVRAHLKKLSRQGVGYKSVAEACDVAPSTLAEILSGKKNAIRRLTADRVLAVTKDAAADHALVDARPTWKLIAEMRERGGLTKAEIAQWLGYEKPALQLRRERVLATTALAVRRLHGEVMREVEEEKRIGSICLDCGFSHAPASRHQALRRALPCTTEQLRESHPCWWDGTKRSAAERRLYRDLRAVGARLVDGLWARPKAASAAAEGDGMAA